MVLERSTDSGVTWTVWQYFAKDCQVTYGIQGVENIGGDPQLVFCSQTYSDILPYTGGQVVFDVLNR